MPSYLHPGVYVEEIPSGSRPIAGVATSTAAFVGITQRNSDSGPELIGSLSDYMELFGPVLTESDHMGLAVQSFYQNGGGAAYICPMSTSATTSDEVFAGITVSAQGTGPWGDLLYIRISDSDSATSFNMELGTRNNDGTFYALENKYENLSLDSASDNYITAVVAERSSYINVVVNDAANYPSDTSNDGVVLTGGGQSAGVQSDYITFYEDTLRKFRDVRVIVLPGHSWPTTGSDIISATQSHCDKVKNCVLILDTDESLELANASVVNGLGLPTSTYTALYYPWIGVSNPLYHQDKNSAVDKTINIASSAAAAGMWAKIDSKRGVWKAPAGVEAQLSGVSSLAFQVENLEQDQLNPLGVNCIRKLPGYGSVFWGARTLATNADPEWRYVPVRRTAIYIEESIYNGIQWAVFEPNDEPLWSSLRANIGGFMNGMFRAGAFQGSKASDAYFVRCGLGDTMTQADIDRGQVIALIGFAALKPAEFVIVRIQQKVGEE